MKIILGSRYRDRVTGLEGIAIGTTKWLTGCDTVGLMPKAQDGKAPDAYWIDITRAEPIGDPVPGLETKTVQTAQEPGGPQPTPKAAW